MILKKIAKEVPLNMIHNFFYIANLDARKIIYDRLDNPDQIKHMMKIDNEKHRSEMFDYGNKKLKAIQAIEHKKQKKNR
jgi:hypothetical protein